LVNCDNRDCLFVNIGSLFKKYFEMKLKFVFIIPILFFTITGFKLLPVSKLQIEIYNLRNSKGQLVVLLYNTKGSIPDKSFSKYYRKKIVRIDNQTAYVEFDNLPAGSYAVNFFHDENSNGKLDKGFVKPKEGFGLSRFQSVNLFNRPDFDKAAIEIKHDTLIRIKTIYL